MFLIVCYSFTPDEYYIEKYSSKEEQMKGLKKMVIRDDIELTENEMKEFLSSGFYSDGYDSIQLLEMKNDCSIN
ncbi:TPA: hypothetical protein ACJ5R3_002125 [Streptococcus agalactiae]|nr:hypothetical protein [Enterococcus faecalis]